MEEQASFSGWARVEIMGHVVHIGFVSTQAFGQAVLFRIDTPELPEREWTLTRPEYDERGRLIPAGTKVRREMRAGASVLVGAGSIYRIVPCSENAAKRAIETATPGKLQVIELPPDKALAAGVDVENEDDFDTEDDDDDAEPDDNLPVGAESDGFKFA